jgi:hypothetical protein
MARTAPAIASDGGSRELGVRGSARSAALYAAMDARMAYRVITVGKQRSPWPAEGSCGRHGKRLACQVY